MTYFTRSQKNKFDNMSIDQLDEFFRIKEISPYPSDYKEIILSKTDDKIIYNEKFDFEESQSKWRENKINNLGFFHYICHFPNCYKKSIFSFNKPFLCKFHSK